MIAATFFSLMFVPSFFVLFQALQELFQPIPEKGDVEATNALTVKLAKDGDGFSGEFTIATDSLG